MKKSSKHGYFPTPIGTCITWGNLSFSDGTLDTEQHPWIVIEDGEETVKLIKAQTLCRYDEKGTQIGKPSSTYTYTKESQRIELTDPHPPLDSVTKRRQWADISFIKIVPKQYLYQDDTVKICNDEGWTLSRKQMKLITDKISKLDPNSIFIDDQFVALDQNGKCTSSCKIRPAFHSQKERWNPVTRKVLKAKEFNHRPIGTSLGSLLSSINIDSNSGHDTPGE